MPACRLRCARGPHCGRLAVGIASRALTGRRVVVASRKAELFFVTLDKSEGYHDRIAYHDYAISAERFHWQSQNSAGPDTPSGRRYLESATNGWQFQLFVRPRKGEAYRACGPVTLESAEGERPMSIVWRLNTPLPARLFQRVQCAARGLI